jgi:hypothetical protein
MTTRSWPRRLFSRKSPPPLLRPARFRPALEALEDRLAPANFKIANGDVAGLIAAITTSNSNNQADMINLAAGSTYTLSAADNSDFGPTGLPNIVLDGSPANKLTINGNGATIGRSTASGTPAFRLLDVAAGASLTLENLTLQNGLASGLGVSVRGGAIYSQGTLALNGVTVQNNTAQGTDGASGSRGPGGDARGGAIYVGGGAVTLNNSTLSDNGAQGGRGADGDIGGNGGAAWGGAIYVNGGASATLINSTLSGNTAQGGQGGSGEDGVGPPGQGLGGGLYIDGTVTLTNLTVSGNSASWDGGGLSINAGTATLTNTIIAGNSGGFDLDIFGDYSGRNNLVGGDPMLAPLGDYGGPTPTMALLPGSLAIDAGDSTAPGLPTTDQRGFTRICGAFVDIGADELQLPILSTATPPDGRYGTAYSQTLTATESGYQGAFTFAVTARTLPAGLHLASDGTLTGTPATAGSFSFTVAATDSGGNTTSQNCTLTIDKAALTITPDGGQSKVYGAAVPALTYSASGFVNGDSSALLMGALGTTAASTSPAGSYDFTPGTLAAGNNYTLVMAVNPTTFAVTPAALTITPDGGQSKVYGAAVPALSYSAGGFVNGDSSALLKGALGTTATSTSPAGSCDFTLGTLTPGNNYTLVLAANPTTFAVTPATLTITPDAGQSKVYGAAVPALTYNASGFVNGDSSALLMGALGTTATSTSPAGSYDFTPGTLAPGNNYTLVLAANPTKLAVTPATLTITPDAGQSKLYGAAVPALTYNASGFVNGDSSALLTGALGTAATMASPVGNYPFDLGTIAAGNNYKVILAANPPEFAVTVAVSNTAVSSSPNLSAFGQTVTFTATVTSGGGTPTGSVDFTEGATDLTPGGVTLSGGVATFTISSLAIGNHTITAFYDGDGSFGASDNTAAPFVEHITKIRTGATIASSVSPSALGDAVTFTATVAVQSSGAGQPTGSVTFNDSGVSIGTGTLDNTLHATFSTSSLAGGVHAISATYTGDAQFQKSGQSPAIGQTVTRATDTTTVSVSPAATVYGQAVTFTVMVKAARAGLGLTPSGAVAFKEGTTGLGNAILDASGRATFSATALTPGAHTVSAIYNSDRNFAPSNSGTQPATEAVSSGSVATTLSASISSSVFGQAVHFTATVQAQAPGGGLAGGTVTFMDGATTLGTAPLDKNAQQAIFTISSLSIGSHTVTAVYGGDGNFNASAPSGAKVEAVSKASDSISLASSLNPSTAGQTVTFTATIHATPPSIGVATGTVTFKDGTVTLGTGTLSSGVATFSTTSLAAGNHAITASYGGDANYSASTSIAFGQAVHPALPAAASRAVSSSSPVTSSKSTARRQPAPQPVLEATGVDALFAAPSRMTHSASAVPSDLNWLEAIFQ